MTGSSVCLDVQQSALTSRDTQIRMAGAGGEEVMMEVAREKELLTQAKASLESER